MSFLHTAILPFRGEKLKYKLARFPDLLNMSLRLENYVKSCWKFSLFVVLCSYSRAASRAMGTKDFSINKILPLSVQLDLACVENAKAEGKALAPVRPTFFFAFSPSTSKKHLWVCLVRVSVGVLLEWDERGQAGFISIYLVRSTAFLMCACWVASVVFDFVTY